MMYTAEELAWAREDFACTFFVPQSVTRIRGVKTGDGGGGQFSTPSAPVIYDGRVVDARRERRHKEGEQIAAVARLQVELPWDADIKATDKLQVGTKTFSVIGTDAGRPEALCLTVDVSGV